MQQEIYALSYDRSVSAILSFLDTYMPNRRPSVEEYPVPYTSDVKSHMFTSDLEILQFLELNPEVPYALYWDSADRSMHEQVMVFHTCDGAVVLGRAICKWPFDEHLRELAAFAGSEYACPGSEAPPPDTVQEFIEFCKLSNSNDWNAYGWWHM